MAGPIPPENKPNMPQFVTSQKRAGTSQNDYLRMVRWALTGKDAVCLTLGIPAVHIDAVLELLRSEFPHVRYRVLTRYNQNGRVLLWSMPSDKGA